MTSRAAAIAAVEGACPQCGASRARTQEYCVECGLRLPSNRTIVARLRRGWLRRLGWYPGDWVWVSLLGLVVAAGGAAVAIAFGSGPSAAEGTTAVARTPRPANTSATSTALPAAPEPGVANGRTLWPSRRSGWTIVIDSYPAAGGTSTPDAAAAHAAAAGLAEVGILDSGRFSSLHPGYYVVFSGIYSTSDEAQAALRSARAAGFSAAYTRQITP